MNLETYRYHQPVFKSPRDHFYLLQNLNPSPSLTIFWASGGSVSRIFSSVSDRLSLFSKVSFGGLFASCELVEVVKVAEVDEVSFRDVINSNEISFLSETGAILGSGTSDPKSYCWLNF